MKLAALVVGFSLRAYQLLVSPFLHFLCGPLSGCRYSPSCSEYAAQAVLVHGICRGSWLAAKRLGRCHPWGGSGYDPVPAAAVDGASRSEFRGCHHAACRCSALRPSA